MRSKKCKIDQKDLLDLISWARRYCDGRSTFAPSSFNQIYRQVIAINPHIAELDKFDVTLTHDSKFFPYAQDGMYVEGQMGFDATK